MAWQLFDLQARPKPGPRQFPTVDSTSISLGICLTTEARKILEWYISELFGANEWTFGSAVFWWLIFFNEAIFRVPPGPSQYGKSIFSPLAINKYIGEVVLSLHSS